MMGAPLVVLDACVLANFSLCDTLLRLAEPPRLYEPKWSEQILRETIRTLEFKLGWPNSLNAQTCGKRSRKVHSESRKIACLGIPGVHRREQRNPNSAEPNKILDAPIGNRLGLRYDQTSQDC